jgi:nucleobase:cation symporter-1, NCS1 family
VALPSTMTVFAGMGVLITSATAIIYGEAIWDPIKLVGKFQSPWIVAISMFTVVVATLSVNIAANVVSPANDFANAFPKYISFRTGGLITGVLGIAMMPWKLLEDPGTIYGWLIGYSGGLGSIAGVLIADYWLVRKKTLALEDLYLPNGAYRYSRGWNWRAAAATIIGCVLAWSDPMVKFFGGPEIALFKAFYNYAWFVGAGSAGLIYWLTMPKLAEKALLPAAPAASQ